MLHVEQVGLQQVERRTGLFGGCWRDIIALDLEGTACFCSEVYGQIAVNGIFIKTVFKYWEVALPSNLSSRSTLTNRNAI